LASKSNLDLSNINNRTSLAANTTKKFFIDLPIVLKNLFILRDCITDDITIKIYFKLDICENASSTKNDKLEVQDMKLILHCIELPKEEVIYLKS